MKAPKTRKIVSMIVISSLLLGAIPASAVDQALQETFQDALYGVMIGTLVGGATVAFTKKPAKHLVNFGIGAGCGAIGGTIFGLAKAVKTLAEVEDGKVKFAMPTIVPEFVDSPAASNKLALSVGLLRITY
ncbi:hypothetical protein FO488_13475 [Geobacter sp. FeAm09]|uniref:hypothetical protein n=1 Tax=Geobacter sp. FeAm09 TaxID=2597769 RepID=UPI0011ECC9CA|nr:hypothetical protein [Geobacter sp. FeAm09]QEM69069.1 hypothetical protein FO488_13475 [Geobacter sp. FeAm09]